MALLDSLKNGLYTEGKAIISDLPAHIKPAFDLAKFYAFVEAEEEAKRLRRAIARRLEKGVTWGQLADLKTKLERAYAAVPEAQKLLALRAKRSKGLAETKLKQDATDEEKAKHVADFKRAEELVAEAHSAFKKATEDLAFYQKLEVKCGITGGASSHE